MRRGSVVIEQGKQNKEVVFQVINNEKFGDICYDREYKVIDQIELEKAIDHYYPNPVPSTYLESITRKVLVTGASMSLTCLQECAYNFDTFLGYHIKRKRTFKEIS